MRQKTILALLALPAVCQAQGFDYPDFSNPAGLALNQDAAIVGGVLRVTPAAGSQNGSVWFDTPVEIGSGFDTIFTFRIANTSAGGADGMAFVIHDDPAGIQAIANLGSAMGYSGSLTDTANGLDRSIAVELDTYQAGQWGDPSPNHLSVHTGGSGDNSALEDYSLGQHIPSTNLSDGNVHTLRVRYFPGTLEVYLDDLATPVITAAYDLSSGGSFINGAPIDGLGLTGGLAYVGFTGSTGGAWEDHDVLSWSFQTGSIGNNYCIGVDNSTGSPAELSAGGSTSVAANNLVLLASPVPDQPGLFFYGPDQTLVPFGDGFRCVGGIIGRLSVVNATGNAMQFSLDNTMPPNGWTVITAGSTWNFQAWYRDPAAQGTGFNHSNGLELTFVP